MKKILTILFSIAFVINYGQYSNDWIDYSKPHFKINVSAEGIYRISSTAIANAGLNFINSDNLQLFKNGVQVPIYINESGGVINFIEFYGDKNDGMMDSVVFKNPNWQIHQEYSLFSDISAYYLTFNSTGGNERIIDVPNDLINLPAKEEYFLHKTSLIYNSTYSYGKPFYLGSTPLYSSLFLEGEGFMGSSSQQINNSTLSRTFNLSTPYKNSNAAVGGKLRYSILAWTRQGHHFKVKIGNTNINEFQFNNYRLVKSQDIISNSLISTSTAVTLEAIPTSSGVNRNTLALLELQYPRNFNFNNSSFFKFNVEANNLKQYVEIENYNNQSTQPILYDLKNGHRIKSTDPINSSLFRFSLPATSTDRELVIRANNSSSYQTISTLTEFYFKDFSNTSNQADYLIVTHSSLKNANELLAYKNYRESLSGGGFSVQVIDIEELYNQFAYGIDHHANTLRAFSSYAYDQWMVKPEYIFVIGKGREYHHYRISSAIRNACLVPTFGQPGSDNLLTTDNFSDEPKIPIGRIAASSGAQISNYLEKVVQYEFEQNKIGDPYQTIEEKAFMKEIIHFGGGSDASQQTNFRNYLNNYKSIAENKNWGANVYSAFKTNSNPLQSIQSEFLREKIDNGVSLITFFGHSYAGGFDFSFDEPENYTNTGKYPIYLANGCNAGAIHSGSQSISERFIFSSQKGAIAYLSTSSIAVGAGLNNFTNYFYRNFSEVEYNNRIGDVIKSTIKNVESCCANNDVMMMIPHEMTLNGDPALKINQYNQPDFNIEAQNVTFSPENVNTSLDSFTINLEVYNLGRAIDSNIGIEVTRILPDGTQESLQKIVKAPYYKETVSLKFPVLSANSGLGLNRFNIYIDNSDIVLNELSETNNDLVNQVELVISSNDIFPIYPYEFAIVPNQNLILKASTGDPFAESKDYIFEIDTSENFTNPIENEILTSIGGVVEWNPNLVLSDSTVYYWRVSGNDNPKKWQYSSFIFLENEFPGWNQSHYFQWQKDKYDNIVLENDKVFKYVDDVKDIFVQTGVYPVIPYQEIKWEMNGSKRHNWSMNICSGSGGFGYHNGLSIVAIDNISGLPVDYYNNGGNYGIDGNIHCNNVDQIKNIANFIPYGTTPSNHPSPGVPWYQVITDYLNSIPNDFYVLIYSVNNPQYASWSPTLVNYLNNKGSTVSNSSNGAMILMYQNNNASFNIVDTVASSFYHIISKNIAISGNWNSGNIKSTLIGPAKKWESLQWKYHSSEDPTVDMQSIDVLGVNNSGVETLLNTVTVNNFSLSSINASVYPFLRLRLNTSDLTDRTPTQLEYWRVIYQKVPELAINPKKHFVVTPDSLEQGDSYNIELAVENVSPWDMDSVWFFEESIFSDNTSQSKYKELDSLKAFNKILYKLKFNTLDSKYIGKNFLKIEANPYGDNYHQLEQFHFNNYAILDYRVIGDQKNPILDVTFDGVHILNGDIVSAKPLIQIQLTDENKYLALDDTTAMQIYIKDLETGETNKIHFTSDKIEFFPADASNLKNNNKALVQLKENFVKDGTYELIVKAADKSSNNSSNTNNKIIDRIYYDYKISFEVINKSTITNVINYPNPFTTQTQFVFTLTGSKIPDFFHIKIFNIKGTLVKQIMKEELGAIHIGLNKTEYTWNGTDQYGDKLANGVYLYKIYTSIDEQEIEHRNIQQVDKFFTKGFGKMVLVR